jgi:hypothetical protein
MQFLTLIEQRSDPKRRPVTPLFGAPKSNSSLSKGGRKKQTLIINASQKDRQFRGTKAVLGKSQNSIGEKMSRIERNEEREERISMEVIVDAYGSEEQAMGWYYYLAENIEFPFKARCIEIKKISPLRIDEVVEALDIVSEDDCLNEMFVKIVWSGRKFGVPLSQLEGIEVDENTEEAILDWHYWISRGHRLYG